MVDLLEHAAQAASSREELAPALRDALARGRFDRDVLRAMAMRYGTRATRHLVEQALKGRAV